MSSNPPDGQSGCIDVKKIVARTTGLSQRLESTEDETSKISPASDPEKLLQCWQEQFSPEDDADWRRRVEQVSGGSPSRQVDPVTVDDVPSWAETLDRLVSTLSERKIEITHDSSEEDPFEHVIDPITAVAARWLEPSESERVLTADARADLRSELASRLERILAQVLFVEFKRFSAVLDGEPTASSPWIADDEQNSGEATPSDIGDGADGAVPEERAVYTLFVEAVLDDGLACFFERYPVAGQLVAVTVEHWISAVERLADRLRTDRAAIRAELAGAEEIGAVDSVSMLGDSHDGGTRVSHLSFESGFEVAYKPRPVAVSDAFESFLEWVEESSSLPTPHHPTVLPRTGYGWVEWLDREECPDRDAVGRYYYRIGVLSCLLYALRFTDGNYENMIAVGEEPALIDVESLCHPSFPDSGGFDRPRIAEIVDESVLSTGLFPIQTRDDTIEGVGGLDELGTRETPIPHRVFTATNTDQMELTFETTATPSGRNLPTVDGEPVHPSEHVDEMVDGFEATGEFLQNHRAELLSADGPLAVFEGVETRTFVRSTMEYARVRRPLVTSKYLKSGARADARIEALLTRVDAAELGDDFRALFRAERAGLRRNDIPRLTVRTDSTDVWCAGRRIDDLLEQSPIEQLKARIADLDTADIEEQADYVRLAYGPEAFRTPDSRPAPTSEATVDTSLLSDQVEGLVDHVLSAGVRTDDGTLRWFLRENRGEGVFVHDLREDFYEGRLGVAVFAAAAAEVLDDSQAAVELFRESVEPVLERIESGEEWPTDKLGICHGRGSHVYNFTKLWQLRDDPRLLEAAETAAATMDGTLVETNDVDDLIGGTAGGILALLSLASATGENCYVERASELGESLLANRTEADGTRVWNTFGGDRPALVGMGHGVSGIALALYRLADRTGVERFRNAALEALQYERDAYDPDREGWPDFRMDTCRRGWCAGRAGVALARTEMQAIDRKTALTDDLDRAVAGMDAETLLDRDHLCCGNFGRVDTLLRLDTRGVLSDGRKRAESLAARTLTRADAHGFTLPWATSEWPNATFFLGGPGVGYTLCRLLNPDLPCLLVCE
jgi:type 2 lantibiotic biosynthesis protein LanM